MKPSISTVGYDTPRNGSWSTANPCYLRVANIAGDPVPGPRPYNLVTESKFPWKCVTDAVEEVSSLDSYRLSLQLSREGIICGPSSGMCLEGLFKYFGKQKEARFLQRLAGQDGKINCVFMCADLPYQYLDEYFSKLGEDFFKPIVNEVGRQAARVTSPTNRRTEPC
jgi:cysteine synthase